MHLTLESFLSNLFLFVIAIIAGAMNGVAGGGGLIGFPALIFAGIPPIQANATNTAGMWVGTAASTFAYRREMSIRRRDLLLLTITSALGGIIGSELLLRTSSSDFANLVPYLMLTATLLFTFGKRFNAWVLSRIEVPIGLVVVFQFAIALYGGFFGGGAGILMLAIFEMMGIKNIHAMNALKSWLATCLNAFALLHFMIAGIIVWFPATLMAIGALIGGYGSAFVARQVNPAWVRSFIICIGVAMTSYFFLKPTA
jgi:uncharacterized protein